MTRIVDAFWTLLRPGWDRRIREMEADLRALQLELTGALESLNAWAAKEYKRHHRELRKQLDQGGGERAGVSDAAAAGQSALGGAPAGQSSMSRRGSIIRRVSALQHRGHREPIVEPGQTAEG